MKNREIILKFINENLEWSANKIIAAKLGVAENSVSKVRHGHFYSKEIFKALEEKALENYSHAQQIAKYLNEKASI